MTREINENELAKKFDALHSKFVANQVNKIQRYLTNNLGLEPINGKKPLNKFRVREFVTQRFVDGKVQYAIKLSYGSKTVAIVPTGSIEADEDSIVKSLTAVYHELLNNEYEGDFWNLFADNPDMARTMLLGRKTSAETSLKIDKDVLVAIQNRRTKQLSYQGSAA